MTNAPSARGFNRRHFLAASGVAAGLGAATAPAKAQSKTAFGVTDLRAEHTVDLLGTDVRQPRLSWRLTGSDRGLKQVSYRIRAASAPDISSADLWDSGTIESDASFDILYGGKPLKTGQRVWWTVDITDTQGRTARATPVWFETGLLDRNDWQADWIIAEDALAEGDRRAGLKWIWANKALDNRPHAFRLDFEAPQNLTKAEVFVAGKDWIRGVWANGEQLPTPDQLVPNWGTLVPVPANITAGRNSVCILVEAETTGFFPVDGGAFAALIRLHLNDGTIIRYVSDFNWKVNPTPPTNWFATDFNPTHWVNAQKSGSDAQNDPRPAEPAMLLRTEFTPQKQVVNARLYATALGAFEARLNGRKVGKAHLTPEISVADSHIFYNIFDVTEQVKTGSNALGFIVGDGFYATAFGWRLERYGFGPAPRRLLAQLRLDYADGTSEWVKTGPDWRIGQSPILTSEIYDGEVYDARLETPDWDRAGFNAAGWPTVHIGQAYQGAILPLTSPLLEQIGTRRATITQPRPDIYVLDFGQNFSGWVRLKVKGQSGQTVKLKFAEILGTDGEVDMANLRMAKCTDYYTLKGDPAGEVYEPTFTYHGFRYLQVEGFPGTPKPADIEAVVISSACKETGTVRFDKAPLIQKFWENALWSQRSNFFCVPTDCPQRDERMGWMGDIQIFLDAAAFNMEVDPFIRRFLIEARAAQRPDGGYPIVVPQPQSFPDVVTQGWSEAGLILPYMLWKRYGDTPVIEENWDAMTKWMDFLIGHNPDHIWRKERGLDLGDWLSVDAVKPDDETTPRILCATAFWAFSADLMREMAEITGRSAEVQKYTDLRQKIGEAYAREFIDTNGKCGNGSQTSQILSLYFGLVPDNLKPAATKVLTDEIRGRGMKLSTGFLGTPYILDVLADNGQYEVVSGLLLQRERPSWGYMPLKGATTMWERWDSDTGDLAMNSYNHYAFGAVIGFMYRRLAGIDTAAAGFRRIRAAPLYLPAVGDVSATYQSVLGEIKTAVRGHAGGLKAFDLTLPAGTTAEVILPQGHWREGGRAIAAHKDVKRLSQSDGYVTLEVGSGSYRFSV